MSWPDLDVNSHRLSLSGKAIELTSRENFIDPSTVQAAAAEIRTGEHFSLCASLPLQEPHTAGFGRHLYEFRHELHLNPHVSTLDDTLTFNTQKSSQWDGLRHFAYQRQRLFYGGVTLDEIRQEGSERLSQHHLHAAGGIVGRGLLIDYWSWAVEHGMAYDPKDPVPIKYDDIMRCLEWQRGLCEDPDSMTPRRGDILFIRVGFLKRHAELSRDEEQEVQTKLPPATCGVDQDVRMLRWLWNSKFAAVAGDAPGWEYFPGNSAASFLYHEVLLAGWGCPIGELLNLEQISDHCRKARRRTFFVASAPLNVTGGVASPANTVAIA